MATNSKTNPCIRLSTSRRRLHEVYLFFPKMQSMIGDYSGFRSVGPFRLYHCSHQVSVLLNPAETVAVEALLGNNLKAVPGCIKSIDTWVTPICI